MPRGRPRKDPNQLQAERPPLSIRLDTAMAAALEIVTEATNLYMRSLGVPATMTRSGVARRVVEQWLVTQLLGGGAIPAQFLREALAPHPWLERDPVQLGHDLESGVSWLPEPKKEADQIEPLPIAAGAIGPSPGRGTPEQRRRERIAAEDQQVLARKAAKKRKP